ncbi:MAG: alpha/beta hydrolase [Lentisphaeria bacterium]|nr:alpha/beta hydrolase [Lentisphaeria bacterium]
MGKIYLWKDENIKTKADRPSITPFLLETSEKRPAILLIPGGGYGNVCEPTEGTPVARRFNELGYHVIVLDYRTAPERFPAPQLDAMRAMKIIRGNADKWNIDADKVCSCGFSAGGHLAASLGNLCDDLDASDGDEFDKYSHLPYAMILNYGVLAFEEWSHLGTQQNLLGEDFREIRSKYSPVNLVDEKTPPAFLWHTVCDQLVNYRCSIEFALAMAKNKRPCELMLGYWGEHGMLLAENTLDLCNWTNQAVNFVETLIAAEKDPAILERYTHAYQAALV